MYTRYALRYITVYMRIYENSTTIFVNTCFSPRHQKPQKVIFFESVSLFLPCLFFPNQKTTKKVNEFPTESESEIAQRFCHRAWDTDLHQSKSQVAKPWGLVVDGGWVGREWPGVESEWRRKRWKEGNGSVRNSTGWCWCLWTAGWGEMN